MDSIKFQELLSTTANKFCKATVRKSLLVIVLLLGSINASAYDFTFGGIYYNVVSRNDLTCEVVSGDEKYKGDIIIPDKVTYNNRTLTVVSIGNDAFLGSYSSLTSVTIPNSVTKIGYDAFSSCSGLKSVTIPNSVKEIGDYAFQNCSGLTSVTIGNSVTNIGVHVFAYCSGLKSVTIGSSVTSIGSSAFAHCSSLMSITIPNSVTSIGYEAFICCKGLTSVTIGNSVTEIGSAFRYCSGLTSITIPNSVTSIGDYTFEGCSGLTSVTIGNSVTSIGDAAFRDCTGLTSVTIPNSVTEIGISAFGGCSRLKELYSLNPVPPTTSINSFTDAQYMDLNVYVPQSSLSAYQSADVWKEFWNMQGFDPTEVKTIKADYKNTKDTYYDIQGRKLNAPKKGLNIINGKKVLIKK